MPSSKVEGVDRELILGVQELMDEIVLLCADVDESLADEVLDAGDGLSDDEARRLFEEVLVTLRSGFSGDLTSGDRTKLREQVRGLVDELVQHPRSGFASSGPETVLDDGAYPVGSDGRTALPLIEANGLKVRPVDPTPTFLGQAIPVREGHVRVTDLNLWNYNHRLKLHIQEFVSTHGRRPDSRELLDIMLGKIRMPGTGTKRDQFQIEKLAGSIAMKGVERPPVIDWWGTPWDGNRRIAACYYILHSDDFGADAKSRASLIKVWQTPENATRDQIDALVLALNFDEEYKLPWPEYVRAQQVYDDYVRRYDQASSHSTVTPHMDVAIRRQVGQKFGIRTQRVTRYVKMVVWAKEFEDFHNENDRDENEIAHRTNALFQYFYELDSGRGEDKLAVKLHADPAFKALVFDLMYEGKFRNWSQVRDLKKVVALPGALEKLREAHAQTHLETAQQLIEDAILQARSSDKTLKQVGVTDRLDQIATWLLEDATVSGFRSIDRAVLTRFRDAVQVHLGTMTSVIEEPGDESAG